MSDSSFTQPQNRDGPGRPLPQGYSTSHHDTTSPIRGLPQHMRDYRNRDGVNPQMFGNGDSADKQRASQTNSSWPQPPQQPMLIPVLGNQGVPNQGGMIFPANVCPPMLQPMMNNMMPFNMVGMMPQVADGVPIQRKDVKKAKKRRKKAKDKPKRPLSAYNIFFKDEREKILHSLPGDDPRDGGKQEILQETQGKKITWPGKKRPPHGKISFESLAKTIGTSWKALSKDRLTYYKAKAEKDLERYAREMEKYEAKVKLQREENPKKEQEKEDFYDNMDTKDCNEGTLKRSKENSLSSDAVESKKLPTSKNKKHKNQKIKNEPVNESNPNQMMGVYFLPMTYMNQNNNQCGVDMSTARSQSSNNREVRGESRVQNQALQHFADHAYQQVAHSQYDQYQSPQMKQPKLPQHQFNPEPEIMNAYNDHTQVPIAEKGGSHTFSSNSGHHQSFSSFNNSNVDTNMSDNIPNSMNPYHEQPMFGNEFNNYYQRESERPHDASYQSQDFQLNPPDSGMMHQPPHDMG